MAQAPVTARRQVRCAAMAAFSVLRMTNAVRLLDSPGALPSQSETMPSLLVRVSQASKEALIRGGTDFTTTVTIEMETRVTARSGEAVQDAIEDLDARVEQALLTNVAFVELTQQIWVETATDITSEARDFVAWTKWTVRCELVEVFDPIDGAPDVLQPVAVPLTDVSINTDGVVGLDISLPQ